MSDPRFIPTEFNACLSHLIEECGEVLHAAGKLQRFGTYSYNPDLPVGRRVTNLEWLRQEMQDLREALDRMETACEMKACP